MRVLAADTTTVIGSVALVEGEPSAHLPLGAALSPDGRGGGVPATSTEMTPQRPIQGESVRARRRIEEPLGHAERLLPTIDALLRSEGLGLESVLGFAVAVGPGSFTGIRIGIATLEGLAFAMGRPLVGVSTLEATAFHYRETEELVAPFLDARRGEVYGAVYSRRGEMVLEPTCESPESFLGRLPREAILIAGSGVEPYRSRIEEALGARARTAGPPPCLAEDVARVGLRLLVAGEAAPLGGLRALYLRPFDAERTVRS